jgi:hypothetical protein
MHGSMSIPVTVDHEGVICQSDGSLHPKPIVVAGRILARTEGNWRRTPQ